MNEDGCASLAYQELTGCTDLRAVHTFTLPPEEERQFLEFDTIGIHLPNLKRLIISNENGRNVGEKQGMNSGRKPFKSFRDFGCSLNALQIIVIRRSGISEIDGIQCLNN